MLGRILDLVTPWECCLEAARLEGPVGRSAGAGNAHWPRCKPSRFYLDRHALVLFDQHRRLVRFWRDSAWILAHDGQMDEFLDAGLIGKVTIHESCHFGSRTIILPNVEVGPRMIAGRRRSGCEILAARYRVLR